MIHDWNLETIEEGFKKKQWKCRTCGVTHRCRTKKGLSNETCEGERLNKERRKQNGN